MLRARVAPAAAAVYLAASLGFAGLASAQEPDQLSSTANLQTAGTKSAKVPPHGHQNGQAHARFGIPDIDSLINFNGHYFADGFDTDGNAKREWYFNTIGNPPQLGSTTTNNGGLPMANGLSRLAKRGRQT